MTTDQEKVFEEQFKAEFEKVRTAALTAGAKAISGVVYDKVKNVDRDLSKNDLLRIIKDIKLFCEKGLSIKEEKTNI